jgi:hypothetical protein
MKRSSYSDEQMAHVLHQIEGGTSVADVCRQIGISESTFYAWRRKYAARDTEGKTPAARTTGPRLESLKRGWKKYAGYGIAAAVALIVGIWHEVLGDLSKDAASWLMDSPLVISIDTLKRGTTSDEVILRLSSNWRSVDLPTSHGESVDLIVCARNPAGTVLDVSTSGRSPDATLKPASRNVLTLTHLHLKRLSSVSVPITIHPLRSETGISSLGYTGVSIAVNSPLAHASRDSEAGTDCKAQPKQRDVFGLALDPSGHPAPGVSVAIEDQATSVPLKVTTDASGQFKVAVSATGQAGDLKLRWRSGIAVGETTFSASEGFGVVHGTIQVPLPQVPVRAVFLRVSDYALGMIMRSDVPKAVTNDLFAGRKPVVVENNVFKYVKSLLHRFGIEAPEEGLEVALAYDRKEDSAQALRVLEAHTPRGLAALRTFTTDGSQYSQYNMSLTRAAWPKGFALGCEPLTPVTIQGGVTAFEAPKMWRPMLLTDIYRDIGAVDTPNLESFMLKDGLPKDFGYVQAKLTDVDRSYDVSHSERLGELLVLVLQNVSNVTLHIDSLETKESSGHLRSEAQVAADLTTASANAQQVSVPDLAPGESRLLPLRLSMRSEDDQLNEPDLASAADKLGADFPKDEAPCSKVRDQLEKMIRKSGAIAIEFPNGEVKRGMPPSVASLPQIAARYVLGTVTAVNAVQIGGFRYLVDSPEVRRFTTLTTAVTVGE